MPFLTVAVGLLASNNPTLKLGDLPVAFMSLWLRMTAPYVYSSPTPNFFSQLETFFNKSGR
jgi:hypothetical protein